MREPEVRPAPPAATEASTPSPAPQLRNETLANLQAIRSLEGEDQIRACIEQAAKDFEIDPLALTLLRRVEGGTVGKVSGNRNGTYDIGPMQINSSWLPRLAHVGLTEPMLLHDACTNVYVAAWIFRAEYLASGKDVVMAMARYHSPTRRHQVRYLGLVRDAIRRHLAEIRKEQERRDAGMAEADANRA